MLIKNAEILMDDKFHFEDILIKGDEIFKIGKNLEVDELEPIIDCQNLKVLPGFIDVHTHGGAGYDINSATSEELDEISRFFARQGVTSFLGSVLTDTKEQTLWCIDQFNEIMDRNSLGARVMGIHLEGPFLAKEFKGAMPEHLLIDSDLALMKEYQRRARGRIKYITLAPEKSRNMSLIKELKNLGMVVSMGHSNATYKESLQAIGEGVTSATHLMNAMRPIHQHEIGIAGATLMSDIYAETICDGLHLAPSTLEFIVHNKGLDKVVCITDCIMAAGLEDGEYRLGVNEVVVKDGDAKLRVDGTRAGSTLTMIAALKNASKFLSKPISQLVKLLSTNPANMMGWSRLGAIKEGRLADFVVVDDACEVIKTIVGGRVVYEK